MDKQKLVDAAIEEMKRDVTHGDWTAIEGLLFNLDTEILKGFLREGQDQTVEQLEAELEATRQKIAEQLSMVGRSIQSIDPTLHEKERELEQAVIDAHDDVEPDTSNCKKCRVVIKNGGDWGYCTCCYEETRAQEEQDDEG